MAIVMNYFPTWKLEFATGYEDEKSSTSHYKLLSLCFSVNSNSYGCSSDLLQILYAQTVLRVRCRAYVYAT